MRKIAIAMLCIACSGSRDDHVARTESAVTQGPWSLLNAASPPQLSNQTATLFGENKLLIIGGITAIDVVQDRGWLYTFELTKRVADLKPGGKLVEARQSHTATVLASGKILIAGGDAAEIRSSAEIADPMTGLSMLTGPMKERRTKHAAARLPDGKVLVAGGGPGIGTSTSEIFDPATGTWSDGPALANPRLFVTATTLKDGRVLIVGGGRPSADLYDPNTKAVERITLLENRLGHTAVLLASGKVMIAGGYTDLMGVGSAAVTNSAEIFDPATKAVTKAPPMPTPRGNATATLMKNGTVMVAGGRVELTPLNYVDFYDETTNAWKSGSPMVLPHALHTATTIGNGDVVITGSASSEVFTPIPTAKACTLAADCASGFCVDGVCCETACTGACERCDTSAARGKCTPVSGAFNHCEPGNTCVQNACVPNAGTTCSPDRLGVQAQDGKITSCAPYACDKSVGVCAKECSTTLDCAPGSICNASNKQCAPAPESDSGGCSASGSPASGFALIGALLMLAAQFRRRLR
jgi:uncharacterized protein (TIGR03382 family)